MPERYSDEHLRLLQQGIPVYPGDEAIIADMARNIRTMSTRYPNQRHPAVTGADMAGNITPRFGMDTARQRSTNLGLPPAKRKVVKTVSADPAVADKVIETLEETIPNTATAATPVRSQNDIMMEQFQTHKAANTVPSAGIFMQSAQAAAPEVGNDPPPQQDPEGNWWVWDWTKNAFVKWMTAIGETQLKIGQERAEAAIDTMGVLTETTGERNRRLAGIEAESNRAEQPIDTGTGTAAPPSAPPPAVARPLQPNFQQGDPVARIYGDWSRDIPSERKDYLRAMKDIWFKMSMLSAVASLTGGEDQSEGFGRMQVEMLNYMMETDNQERLLKIHKGVYFNKDGKWDPPKNERMAHQRAVRFGAGPDEASEFSGFYPKKTETWQNWKVKEIATSRELTMASQGRPEGYDPDLFEFTIVPPSTSARGKFMEYKLRFDAASKEEGRQTVAKQWARELLRQSGMPIVQPPTQTQIDEAYEELRMGEEYTAKNISGRQD